MVGVADADAFKILTFACHRLNGIFIYTDHCDCFTVKHDNFNIGNNTGSGILLALVNLALQGFCLNINTHDLTCITYPN